MSPNKKGQKCKKFCFYSYQPESIGSTQVEHMQRQRQSQNSKLFPRGRRFKLNSIVRTTEKSSINSTLPLDPSAPRITAINNEAYSFPFNTYNSNNGLSYLPLRANTGNRNSYFGLGYKTPLLNIAPFPPPMDYILKDKSQLLQLQKNQYFSPCSKDVLRLGENLKKDNLFDENVTKVNIFNFGSSQSSDYQYNLNPCENSLNNLKKSISMSHLESATVPLLNQTSENYYNNGRREAPNAIYLNNILTVNNDTNTEKFSRSGFSSSSVDVLNYENKNNTYSASSNTVKHNLNNNINCSYSSNSFNNFGNKDVNNSSNDRFKSIISGSNANLVTSTTNSNRTESNNYKSTNISYDKSLTGNGNNNSDGKNINNINSDTTITTSDNINNNNNNTANKNNTNGYNNNNSTDSNNNNSNNNSNLFPRVDVVGLSSNLLFEDILSADAFDNNLQPVISGSILNNETTNHNFQPSKLLAEVDNTLLIHEMLISNETQNLGQQLAENSSISTQLSGLKSMPSEQWLELPNFQQSHNLHKQLGLLQQFNLQQNLSQPYTEPSAALANLEIKTDF